MSHDPRLAAAGRRGSRPARWLAACGVVQRRRPAPGRARPVSRRRTSPCARQLGAGRGRRSTSSPGPATPRTAPTTRRSTGSRRSRRQTGCKVNVKIAGTSDEMVNLMKTGQYDVVSASGDASLRLIAAGDVAPVNTDLVPNYADVFAGLKKQPWNSRQRRRLRHPARPGRQPADVQHRQGQARRRPRGARSSTTRSPYKGKVTAYDSPIYIADAALYLMKTKPELGIKNPYALDQKQFDAAVDLLKAAEREHRRVLVGLHQGDRRPSRAATRCSAPRGRSSPTSPRPTKAPVEAVLPERGRDRLVGHLDGRRQGQAPQLRVQVDGLDRLARR